MFSKEAVVGHRSNLLLGEWVTGGGPVLTEVGNWVIGGTTCPPWVTFGIICSLQRAGVDGI